MTARRASAVLVLGLLGGCASRPLTRPAELGPLEQGAVGLAVVGVVLVLAVHVERWVLGRDPTHLDDGALFLGVNVALTVLAIALLLYGHHRATELVERPVGEEAEVIITLRADCGVTAGDGFLEFHLNPDSCNIRDGRVAVVPIALFGFGAAAIGRARRGQPNHVLAGLATVLTALTAAGAFDGLAPGLQRAFLMAAALAVTGLVAAMVRAHDRRAAARARDGADAPEGG